MVRDRLVAGIISTKLRDKLLSVGSNLTLIKTLDLARTHEVTKQQNKVMSGQEKINYVRSKQNVNKGSSMGSASGPAIQKLERCEKCGKSHGKMTVKQWANSVESVDGIIILQPCARPNLPQARNTDRNNLSQNIVQKCIRWIMKQTTAVKMNYLWVWYMSVNSISQDWEINPQVNNKTIQMHIDSGPNAIL